MTDGSSATPDAPDLTAVIAAGMTAAVPFSATLGVQFVQVTAERAVVRLPDRADLHNHVGGPHAGVLFSVAETASGAVVMAAFGDGLARWTPLAYGAEVAYKALAMGDVTAEAVLGRTAADVRADFDADGKARFPVTVTVRDGDGTETTEVTVVWALRANG